MIIHFAQQDIIPTGHEDFFPACSEAGLLMPKKQSVSLAASKWFSAFASVNQWGILAEVFSKILISFREPVDFTSEFKRSRWDPSFLRLKASAATLSGSIGKGMFYPFPALSA
jgi:hypothetical protein